MTHRMTLIIRTMTILFFQAKLHDIKILFRGIASYHPQYFVKGSKDPPFYRNLDSVEERIFIHLNKNVPCFKVALGIS